MGGKKRRAVVLMPEPRLELLRGAGSVTCSQSALSITAHVSPAARQNPRLPNTVSVEIGGT